MTVLANSGGIIAIIVVLEAPQQLQANVRMSSAAAARLENLTARSDRATGVAVSDPSICIVDRTSTATVQYSYDFRIRNVYGTRTIIDDPRASE